MADDQKLQSLMRCLTMQIDHIRTHFQDGAEVMILIRGDPDDVSSSIAVGNMDTAVAIESVEFLRNHVEGALPIRRLDS